jgi:tRNA pseudouridine38-40 synthase
MRVLLTIQYLGTRYAGWQRQANALAVQQVIEGALEKMCGQSLRIEGAGRTDSGVHAMAQRAHADIPLDIDARGIVLGLNDLLPHDIRITAAQQVADAFHCRFEALEKTYEYRIWNAPVADVFHFETYAHLVAQLDAEAMREAAAALVGEHDFRAFTVPQPGVSSMVRTVSAVAVVRERAAVRFTITADGFLRFMVRRIAGSLIEIGRGRMGREGIATALEPHFGIARWTAPAKGLVLQSIRYAEAL